MSKLDEILNLLRIKALMSVSQQKAEALEAEQLTSVGNKYWCAGTTRSMRVKPMATRDNKAKCQKSVPLPPIKASEGRARVLNGCSLAVCLCAFSPILSLCLRRSALKAWRRCFE